VLIYVDRGRRTFKEDDWLFRGFWKLPRGTDDHESLALERLSPPAAIIQTQNELTGFGPIFFHDESS